MKIIEIVPEFLGTFALVFSILTTGNYIVIGLTLAAITFLTGDLSGAHVNPAVSLAMLMNKSINAQTFYEYVAAQIIGGISAYYTYNMITKYVRS